MKALQDYIIVKPSEDKRKTVSGLEVKQGTSNKGEVLEGSSDSELVGKTVVYIPNYAEFTSVEGETIAFVKKEHVIAIL